MARDPSQFVKKALTLGVGAVFLTEESLRALIGDLKVSKEMLSGVLDAANKTKTEFLKNIAGDIRERVIEKIDPQAFLQEFLSRNDLEFHIRLSVKPKKPNSKEVS